MYRNCGRVTRQKSCQPLAPSSVAASYSTRGICLRPIWYSSVWNGMNCQAMMATMTYSARLALPSQFCCRNPRFSECESPARPPKLGSSRASHISAIPAVDSSSGST